jgi:hypothetical protein
VRKLCEGRLLLFDFWHSRKTTEDLSQADDQTRDLRNRQQVCCAAYYIVMFGGTVCTVCSTCWSYGIS